MLLKNRDGKYLLLKRNRVKYPEMPTADLWDIVGGRIEIGTPLIDNLKREVMEETSLSLADTPKLIAAQDILRLSSKHVVRLTYAANIDGEPQLDEEHVEYRWVTREEMQTFGDKLDIYVRELLSKNII